MSFILDAVRNEVQNQTSEMIEENKKERKQLRLDFEQLEKDMQREKRHHRLEVD